MLVLRHIHMIGLCIRPLVYNKGLRDRPSWTGRCIILRRDGCRCRMVGWMETCLDRRGRLRFGRSKAILVRDACMALQQIASSKSRPTEADERFLLSIWARSAFSISYGRMNPNGTYECAHGAPNVLYVENPDRNGYKSGPLRRGPLSGVMGMASGTPSTWRKEAKWARGKVFLRRALRSLLQPCESGDSNCPHLPISPLSLSSSPVMFLSSVKRF